MIEEEGMKKVNDEKRIGFIDLNKPDSLSFKVLRILYSKEEGASYSEIRSRLGEGPHESAVRMALYRLRRFGLVDYIPVLRIYWATSRHRDIIQARLGTIGRPTTTTTDFETKESTPLEKMEIKHDLDSIDTNMYHKILPNGHLGATSELPQGHLGATSELPPISNDEAMTIPSPLPSGQNEIPSVAKEEFKQKQDPPTPPIQNFGGSSSNVLLWKPKDPSERQQLSLFHWIRKDNPSRAMRGIINYFVSAYKKSGATLISYSSESALRDKIDAPGDEQEFREAWKNLVSGNSRVLYVKYGRDPVSGEFNAGITREFLSRLHFDWIECQKELMEEIQ
jgi:hypothetical protein